VQPVLSKVEASSLHLSVILFGWPIPTFPKGRPPTLKTYLHITTILHSLALCADGFPYQGKSEGGF